MERRVQHGPSGPIFVGGTGRCGTHAVAALAAHSGRYALIPAELHLHVSGKGLPRFACGRWSRGRLVRELGTRWWRRRPGWDPSRARGVHRVVPRRRYLAAVARLASARPGADRISLARNLVASLLDPLAPVAGAWVEKTPANCAEGGFLGAMFPGMRLIHVVRDGRDVACSFMRVPWAPDDFEAALRQWEESLLDAHGGTLDAPPGSVHRLTLEDLVVLDRDRSYRALLAFLGVGDEPGMRSFFEGELTPARAHIGRWRSDLPRSEHGRAQALYEAALERLGDAGVWPLPRTPPGDALPARDRRARSPIDPWAAATA